MSDLITSAPALSTRETFLAAIAANPTDTTTRLAYADWLAEQGDTAAEAEQRRIAQGGQSDAELAERAKAAARTFFHRSGLVGNQWSQSDLATGIRRNRPRGSGSRKALAIRLGEALDRLAQRRWDRQCKGQRGPTPKQALTAVDQIHTAVDQAQTRARERCVSSQEVILAARQADIGGRHSIDGGRVTCSSYGYRWSTTTVYCQREAGGLVSARIDRTAERSVSLPARTWQDITLDGAVLRGGGRVGIRRQHGWDCYEATGALVGVAIPVTDAAVAARWSKWEHGRTVAEAQAEIVRKRGILRAEAEKAAADKAAAEFAAKNAARIDRAARLLARIGVNAMVSYDDARAIGACDAGLRAFASRNGLAVDAKLPLSEVAKLEPAYAVKIARRLVTERMTAAV